MKKLINFHYVLNIISRNLFIIGSALLANTVVAFYYSEDFTPFTLSASVVFSISIVAYFSTRKKLSDRELRVKDAYLTVFLSWVTLGLFGSLPYLISGAIPGFVNAFFESVSGFTTTGSSILTDIEALPKSILFWRSLTHWIGGIGIILIVVLIMPSLKMGGYHLLTLESSIKMQEKINPSIRAVGNRLLLIYLMLTLAEVLFLLIGHMSFYESLLHAFGTVATGGFSPKNTSIAGYSPYIQYVIMVFMLLSGASFVMHYFFLKLNFRKILENEEFKFYLFMIFVIGMLETFALYEDMGKPLEESFREAYFQVISIITCTGFASADYLQWPHYSWMIIFLAMFLGGSTGSTAGGIKMARHLVLLKNLKKIMRRMMHPNLVMSIRLNSKPLTDNANGSILTFIVFYLIVFVTGTLLMVMTGLDGVSAGGAVATCMAGIGPGLGSVGPAGNFAHLTDAGKLILTVLMLVGRLEVYGVIILFTRAFWSR